MSLQIKNELLSQRDRNFQELQCFYDEIKSFGKEQNLNDFLISTIEEMCNQAEIIINNIGKINEDLIEVNKLLKQKIIFDIVNKYLIANNINITNDALLNILYDGIKDLKSLTETEKVEFDITMFVDYFNKIKILLKSNILTPDKL